MSWSRNYNSSKDFLLDKPSFPPPTDHDEPHVREQIDAAREAARALIASGAIGKKGIEFSVNLSGHANPEHKPAPNYANDTVTINIYQK
jgi:hypothetical protein